MLCNSTLDFVVCLGFADTWRVLRCDI